MLEGLSNITTQTYYPLCEHKKINKLDDSKKISILKKGNRDRRRKNYGNKLEVKSLEMNQRMETG